jgi:hypothetical protein
MVDDDDPRQLKRPSRWSWTTPECCSVSLFLYLKREKKYIQSDQPAWNPGGASATPKSRKIPVFDCAVALCTMQNELLVISNLTWLDYLKSWRQFKALRSTIWFFCDACHKLEVDIYYLARSGVNIIETGWNLRLEKRMWIKSLIMFVV